jgi:hypothetical protein
MHQEATIASLGKADRLDGITRPILMGLLVLYGFATTTVPLADTLLEIAAHESVQHIEEVSAPHSVGHDELTCALCQFVGLPSLAPPTKPQIGLQNTRPMLPSAAEVLPHALRWFSPLGPRGPPPA